jgi:Mrp family chromosome partitioning ATPase
MREVSEAYENLRVRVEARAELPAIVLVSAAQHGDGTTSVACGLARAFAAGGQRTLLIDANPVPAGVAGELGVSPLPPLAPLAHDFGARNGEFPRLSLVAAPLEGGAEAAFATLLRESTERFAVTLVDAGPLPASSVAVRVARCADAVILAVRLGRRPSENDREAIELAGQRFIGVVPTRARAVRPAPGEPPAAASHAALHAIVPTAGAVR